MEQQTKTKKALIMSVLSVFLCIAMLIGMTFAWFTDTASTGVNKIVAGNLKVELLNKEGTKLSESDSLKWVTSDTGDILWEPNCRYNLEGFKVKNAGNLALKYKLVLKATDITTTTDGKSLLDVIDWTIKVEDTQLATITSDQIKNGLKNGIEIITDESLAANETSGLITVQGHMRADAGNDYQNLTIEGFGVTVYATQNTVENDSYGNTYDASADYPEVQPVSTTEGFKSALESDDVNGKTIKLYNNIDTGAEALNLSNKDVALDLNGKTLDTKKLDIKNSTVVIKDSSTGEAGELKTEDSYGVVNAVNSDVTIESGNFISKYAKAGSSGYANVIQTRNSNLTVNGGRFENSDAVGSYNYLIKVSSYGISEKTTVTINGGEFVSHRNYGYIITGDSGANVDVIINGGSFTTNGSNSYLTNVKGNVVVNNCVFTANGNHTVFNIPTNSTVTVKGGTYKVNENAYTDPSLAGFIFHRKTNGWTSVDGTLLVDPTSPVKINQETYSGFIAQGATQSAKGSDGFYTISK